MDEWVLNALKRWPNVPALFGWLGLDRRGRWLVQGEAISHPRIIDVINRNYAADEHGRWYFQNGPQRGYMQLESTPLILFVADDNEHLTTHTGLAVAQLHAAYIDEEGSLVLTTEHGPGELRGTDLQWALDRLSIDGNPVDDDALATALGLPSQSRTDITLTVGSSRLALQRLDFAGAPSALSFDRAPAPREGEKVSTRAMD
ncbi:DUF2946 family protein [Steroidobacter agaridevorans]|uniref:DUF2946 family protein n=1 Tax=Steroidobacter agaridevorans TaxID=2695856 RepID=UPI0013276E31|nr:DUF2946 family protein [Steroidobacter agaridevorans]GFE90320.1 hypothetical protein GCM10011488_52740 [Steroidobacter agaridevorans]